MISSEDLITHLVGGTNLVDGLATWEHAESGKHDLKTMLACCQAELETMKRANLVAAPFYFERAAILLRRAKQWGLEVKVCELYVAAVDSFYSSVPQGSMADVRKGPSYSAILKRIPKARTLLDRAHPCPATVKSRGVWP